jgi:2-phosphosulfolactate phosphatase
MAAMELGKNISVIPAGERWKEDHCLRPSFEDLIGAGAIITHLAGKRSPEAVSAMAAFQEVESELTEYISQCSSGKELIERDFFEDVHLAAQLNVSDAVPILLDEAFVLFNRRSSNVGND